MEKAQRRFQRLIRRALGLEEFFYLSRATIEVNDICELAKLFRWQRQPVIQYPGLDEYRYIEDLNQRRRRDVECVAYVAANANASRCLEIGTGRGYLTATIGLNAPEAAVYTINIPPEEFDRGGRLTTMKLERDEIGAFYREIGLKNITQIFANTAIWQPDLGEIQFAFIDGSHDSEFVVNDTKKVLQMMKPGGFILWHDFNLSLAGTFPWIFSVCKGLETLYARKVLRGRIYHVRDSWVGIYIVP